MQSITIKIICVIVFTLCYFIVDVKNYTIADYSDVKPIKYVFIHVETPDSQSTIGFPVKNSTSSRIIGGTPAKETEYPFMVSLQAVVGGNKARKFCGGTIVSQRWVLTAAHCFAFRLPGPVIINAGSTEAFTYSGPSQVRQVVKIVKHPKFELGLNKVVNDIALLKLHKDLSFNKHVYAIDLPPYDTTAEDIGVGKVLGWGAVHPKMHHLSSNELQVLNIKVMPPDACKKFWKVHSKVLCVKNDDETSPCVGDSGGPFIQNIDDRPVIVGITSYGARRGCTAAPAVYTRVAEYLDFIEDTLDEENEDEDDED